MTFTAFESDIQLAAGDLASVSRAVVEAQAKGAARVLIVNDETGAQTDPDLHASSSAHGPEKPSRGRPRLGVVAREVTLLPRHWDWLSEQPGGASAALRRLVEEARRANAPADQARRTQTAVYRAMSALAGDRPGFEEALRALYAADDAHFDALIADWPPDIRAYVARLSAIHRAARMA
ncbi:DUF2239 family protein [Phenylobacterium sp. VNQ135]|uniref:DUF2239 family protein n=1 Tax=Phenylobacterium sp. VNQ135 TaxID=3400922 RepID=UPI003BFC4549